MKYNLFFSKRGEGQKSTEALLLYLFGALIALFIFVTLINIGNDLRNNTLFERNALDIDLATIFTTASNPSGNFYIDYPKDTSFFAYGLEESNFQVKDNSELFPIGSNYPVLEDKNLVYIYTELVPTIKDNSEEGNIFQSVKIRLKKDDDKISFEDREYSEPEIQPGVLV